MNRIILWVNVAIGVAVLGAAGGAYWYASRPLAVTVGTLDLPVSKPVRVVRDSLGVAHIEAQSIEDAIVAQGFITAQDRLFQMDGMRRLAGGELAEILGPAGLENDQEALTLRMRRTAAEHARRMKGNDKALFAAYARGVNHYLETHRANPPVEFKLIGYDPRPWGVQDSVLAGLQMFRSLSATWKSELLKRQMLAKGDPQKVKRLFPLRSGGEAQMGSNAWVISGRHTATGKPILANDTHLEWGFPSPWYMVHLKAPGLNVTGFSIPGIPAVLIGHNDRVAWGITNLHFDVQDLYLEEFDALAGRYRFAGQVEAARLETDTIRVKGRPGVSVRQWVTRHGPVIAQEGAAAIAMRWVAYGDDGFEFPFLSIGQARNWQEFGEALKRFSGPGSNFLYADVDGNIGYQAAGRMPVRAYDGDVPVPGAGDHEWNGAIPFDKLPSSYNPASGVLISANQNPFPENFPFAVNGNFAPNDRAQQIAMRLGSKQGWKAQEMLSIQTDVYSAPLRFLAGEASRVAQGRPGLDAAVSLLKPWNGQVEGDSGAAFLATLFYQRLRLAIGERAVPGLGQLYDTQMATAVVAGLLRERPAGWFASWDELMVKSLEEAVAEGRKLQGDDLGKWSWRRSARHQLAHPVISRVPYVGRYFGFTTPVENGSSTTVKQTTRRLGPAMRFVADLGGWENSLANVTIGQSGQVLSRHFRDQWEEFRAGRSFPMVFGQPAGDVLELQPVR